MFRNYRFFPVIFALIAFCSCQTTPRDEPKQSCSGMTLFQDVVPYCVRASGNPQVGDVQVLVDGSGSMVGFDPKLPEIVRWSQHAISAIQGQPLTIRTSRICTFREKEGISGCTGITGQSPPIVSHGDTNLHEAINSTRDYALTLIVTDGVAATGDRGKGSCATGVDAACVARSLVDAIHSNDTSDDRGIWIVPLIAPYEGQFFTEESISPGSFRSQDAIDKVRSDIPIDSVIQNPQTGYGGKLVYTYKGPRSLLLIAIAKKSEVGRSAIQALWERADYLNVTKVDALQKYSGGIAALTPIEVYPGYLNRVRWETLKDSDSGGMSKGTIDAQTSMQGDKTSIQVNCPNAGENRGTFTLNGSDKPTEIAGCVSLRMFPAFSYDLRAARDEDKSELSQLLTGFKLASCSGSSLDLDLACSTQIARKCGENPIPVQWVASMKYGAAADSLNSSSSPAATVVNGLSTAHPSMEPHKITALSLILELFYREVANDARSTVLNSFEICKQ